MNVAMIDLGSPVYIRVDIILFIGIIKQTRKFL